jgi:hypothetical protein
MTRALQQTIPILLLAGGALSGGCSTDSPGASDAGSSDASPPAQILSFAVRDNPNSTISAIAAFTSAGASRAHVELMGGPEGAQATEEVTIAGDTGEIPVLGLRPQTDYRLRLVVAAPSGMTVQSDWQSLRTGRLPDSIVAFETEMSDPAAADSGLTLLAVSAAEAGRPPHPAVIVDRSGRVVWYREVSGTLADFQLQPNGHLTAAVSVPSQIPYYAGTYVEWDALGNPVGTWLAQGLDFTDSHELRLLDDGARALLFGFQSRTLDISEVGGPTDATLVGDVLLRQARDGTVEFQWNAFDHLRIEDADAQVWQMPEPAGYDFTHANAIEIDGDGNYLLSIRHFSVIVKVDAHTGAVLWQMGGGKSNQFQFIDDPQQGFTMMHAIRRLPNGNFLFIDNGNLHTPPSSRAVEYQVDEQAHTARLVWSYEPGVFSCCMGFAQRLPSGNTLVNLGQDYRVDEVTPDGRRVWQLRLPNAGAGFFGIYRASRIPSLASLLAPEASESRGSRESLR